MADLFNKHIKKATSRTKEKLMVGIGKAKATQDEVFDSHAANLIKQSKACERLHKDIKVYTSALKALCHAERTLRDTVRDAYEPEWPEKEHLGALLDNLDIQTNELEKAMGEDLIQGVGQYVSQFKDLSKKVDKRGRKLVDYDHAKNSYNSLKSSSKKVDSDPKVAKALIELQQAEAMYTEINNELLEILPATYDSRITFFVDTLQTMFNAHSIHQTEASKLNKQVVSQLDKLGQSMDYLRVDRPEPRTLTPIDTTDTGSVTSSSSPQQTTLSVPSTPQQPPSTPTPSVVSRSHSPAIASSGAVAATPSEGANPFDDEPEEEIQKKKEEEKDDEVCENKVYPKLTSAPRAEKRVEPLVETPKKKKSNEDKESNNPFDDSEEDEKAAVTAGDGEESKEERKVLYMVKSSHEYKAMDTDELHFPAGVEIKVLESFPSDQLDDGWQYGELADGSRGVFPENFTKKA